MLTLTFAQKPLSYVATGVTRVAARGFVGVKNLTRAFMHRREILRLAELDERGLKDIGLVRSDIDGALSTSWLNDPSAILAARSSAQNGAASARREEGLRQAMVKRPRPVMATRETTVACNA
jgi:uncharacterized protein YjiS (DUF1127 family)